MHLCIQRKTIIPTALSQLYLTAYLDCGAGENEKSKGMPHQHIGSPNRTGQTGVICSAWTRNPIIKQVTVQHDPNSP